MAPAERAAAAATGGSAAAPSAQDGQQPQQQQAAAGASRYAIRIGPGPKDDHSVCLRYVEKAKKCTYVDSRTLFNGSTDIFLIQPLTPIQSQL